MDVEAPLAATLYTEDGEATEYKLIGIVDLILMDDAGAIVVVDNKTAAKAKSQSAVDDDLQFSAYAYLAAAITEGRIGTMNWLARDPSKRCDPASLLPGARSVIGCALQYGEGGIQVRRDRRDQRNPSVNKARFARGQDYHEVVRFLNY